MYGHHVDRKLARCRPALRRAVLERNRGVAGTFHWRTYGLNKVLQMCWQNHRRGGGRCGGRCLGIGIIRPMGAARSCRCTVAVFGILGGKVRRYRSLGDELVCPFRDRASGRCGGRCLGIGVIRPMGAARPSGSVGHRGGHQWQRRQSTRQSSARGKHRWHGGAALLRRWCCRCHVWRRGRFGGSSLRWLLHL